MAIDAFVLPYVIGGRLVWRRVSAKTYRAHLHRAFYGRYRRCER